MSLAGTGAAGTAPGEMGDARSLLASTSTAWSRWHSFGKEPWVCGCMDYVKGIPN